MRQLPGVATVSHHVRLATQVNPGRPALWLGLRIAAAVGLPLALSPLLPAGAATWAPLAGYSVALVDKGGAYRSRARMMASAALGTLVALVVGVLASGSGPAAVAVAVLGATTCALGQAWGPAGAALGNTIALNLMIATFLPAAGGLGEMASGVVLGAGWALVLGLLVWPVRVYAPARRALRGALLELADHARALAHGPARGAAWRDDVSRRHRAVRDRIELARATVVATRRGKADRSRGERMLALTLACDRMFGTLVALEEVIDAGARSAAIVDGLAHYAAVVTALAERVVDEDRRATAIDPLWDAAAEADPYARAVLERVHQELLRASERVEALAVGANQVLEAAVEADPAPPVGERLRAIFDLDSAVLRHALRVACCVAVAGAATEVLALDHGYWITVTTYLLLQPSRAATTTRTIQRAAGTVAGAVIAAVVAWAVQAPLALMVIIVAFAGIGASVLQLNYALFSLFTTPTFVLLAEVHTQDFTLVEVRVAYTLIGGALAFLAGLALWPGRESLRFDEQMARAVEAGARYVAAVRAAIAGRDALPSPTVVRTRRAFGLALNNAELALDRVLAERAPTAVIEPRLTMLMAMRRLGGAVNVLGSTRAVADAVTHQAALAAFAREVEDRLDQLAGHIRAGSPPPPPRPRVVPDEQAAIATRLQRIDLQVRVLAEAAGRAGG